jgi:hypothetical protein
MRNAIQRLLKEHGEIALVAETASFQSNYCFEVSFGFAEDRTFFLTTTHTGLINVCREKRLSTQQRIYAFQNTIRFTLGTNSLESRLPGFVA